MLFTIFMTISIICLFDFICYYAIIVFMFIILIITNNIK